MNSELDLLRKQIEGFTKIDDRDWEMLLPHLRLKKIKKHQLFSEEGKKADEVGFIIEGMFRQFYVKDGEEKTTYFFFEQHFYQFLYQLYNQFPIGNYHRGFKR